MMDAVRPLLPSLATLVDTMVCLAWGVGVSAALGFAVGVAMGLVPLVRATLGPLVAVLSMIPPLALLPILFIRWKPPFPTAPSW
jgi:ABC-type nitrate/sulfonate/bicarbonate transport system permease component